MEEKTKQLEDKIIVLEERLKNLHQEVKHKTWADWLLSGTIFGAIFYRVIMDIFG